MARFTERSFIRYRQNVTDASLFISEKKRPTWVLEGGFRRHMTKAVIHKDRMENNAMASNLRNAPLNPLRTFAVAFRHSSFTAAAQVMNISQVAVSRQISTLEDYLGLQLFERGTSSVKLTVVGRAFGERISPLFQEIEEATQHLREASKESMVSIRSYPAFINYWLIPRLPGFIEKYPDLEFSFDDKVERVDFSATHLDFAIQLGQHGDQPDCEARILFPEDIDIVCSPEYLERIGGVEGPGDLAKATVLYPYYRQKMLFEKWASINGVEELVPQHGFHFQAATTAYEAAINGVGMCMAQLRFVDEALDKGRLIRPFPTKVDTEAQFWIVWPRNRATNTHAKRAIDWILEEAGQPKAFFKMGEE